MDSSVSENYARKFCKEYPNENFQKREQWFNVEENLKVLNGESAFGPHETWPAQIEDFIYFVSKNNNGKFDYDSLKENIFSIHPEIAKRNYSSFNEYESTMGQLFEASIIAVKKSKIESIFQRNFKKEKSEAGLIKQVFVNLEERSLKRNNLNQAILRFDNSVPSYLKVSLYLKKI